MADKALISHFSDVYNVLKLKLRLIYSVSFSYDSLNFEGGKLFILHFNSTELQNGKFSVSVLFGI